MLIRLVASCGVALCLTTAAAGGSFRLREPIRPGSLYHVSSRVELEGALRNPMTAKDKPPQTLTVNASSVIEYDERVLEAGQNEPARKTLRIYQRLDFRRKVGEQTLESALRAEVRRMVLLRNRHTEVPFSPDGPLMWSEIDRVRRDVFTPALVGLLPEGEVRVGDRWPAGDLAVQELTDLEQVANGKIECTLHEVTERGGRKFAHIRFAGTVTGNNEDGPNRQQLDGSIYFDLTAQAIVHLSLKGVSWLLDKDNKPLGQIEGRFQLSRNPITEAPALSDDAVRRLALEPTAENTRLLFDEPSLGVRFVYPRRWTVRRADARQIVLDEPTGGGVLITLEPLNLLPTSAQFQGEVSKWLQGQKARVTRANPVRSLAAAAGQVEHFRFEAELDRAPAVLDYYVLRQQAGGATFAARLPAHGVAALQADLEAIAQSLRLVPPKR